MIRDFILIFFIGLTITGCAKNSQLSPAESLLPSKSALSKLPDSTLSDIRYGSDEKQIMDVYLPANRTKETRLIIIIHGGGWTTGDKSDFDSYVTELKKRLPDYAFANLNYRLASNQHNRFPTQENDIKSAITYLKDKSGDYVISNQMIFIGISAGAHLALLQAYKHADVIQPKGIVSFFGPTDLEELHNSSLSAVLESITGYTPKQNPAIYKESSPINYVSTMSPPTLLLHGDADDIVPLTQATILQQKLDSLHVENKLVIYPGQGHGWTGDLLTDSFNKIEAFIKAL